MKRKRRSACFLLTKIDDNFLIHNVYTHILSEAYSCHATQRDSRIEKYFAEVIITEHFYTHEIFFFCLS
jgi:hypothetical protein